VKAHNQRRFSVKFESPGPKLRETVLALRAIWQCWQKGTPLQFKGEFFHFDLMPPFFNPGPIEHPKIPIFIAGVNRYMCRMAGEVCDGLHVHPFHTPKYLREYVHPAVEDGLRASGRSRQDFTYSTASFVVVGDTERERAQNSEAAKQQIAFYASTRTYEPVLASHGWEGIMPELHRKSLEGDWEGMTRLITDEMLEQIAVCGTYDTIGVKLRERYAGLLDRIALYQPYEAFVDESRAAALVRKFKA
jgi:probable F420-dependent oxidoreductase